MEKGCCKGMVWSQFHQYQCRNKATQGEYCGIHSPAAVAKRKAKSEEQYQKHWGQVQAKMKEAEIARKLIAFARWVIEESRHYGGCDVDGGSIHDKLVALGLLQGVEVTEPCGEHCWCAEYCVKFPAECLRLVDGVKEGG